MGNKGDGENPYAATSARGDAQSRRPSMNYWLMGIIQLAIVSSPFLLELGGINVGAVVPFGALAILLLPLPGAAIAYVLSRKRSLAGRGRDFVLCLIFGYGVLLSAAICAIMTSGFRGIH